MCSDFGLHAVIRKFEAISEIDVSINPLCSVDRTIDLSRISAPSEIRRFTLEPFLPTVGQGVPDTQMIFVPISRLSPIPFSLPGESTTDYNEQPEDSDSSEEKISIKSLTAVPFIYMRPKCRRANLE